MVGSQLTCTARKEVLPGVEAGVCYLPGKVMDIEVGGRWFVVQLIDNTACEGAQYVGAPRAQIANSTKSRGRSCVCTIAQSSSDDTSCVPNNPKLFPSWEKTREIKGVY
jgi:hypothetical protein